MKAFEPFEEICKAMSESAFYPHPTSDIVRIDTHISAVFLTGYWVYKLKKPVDFGFLDFRDLEARRYFCEQEVRLNQRLSSGVYEGVIEVRKTKDGRYTLGGIGITVEYAVKMRQLPEASSLRAVLNRYTPGAFVEMPQGPHCGLSESSSSSNGILQNDAQQLGGYLADFYLNCARSPEIDHYGDPDVISFNMEENFLQMEPFIGSVVSSEQWEFIRQVSRAFFKNWRELFEERVASGRIRDGHGDLRSEHIYFFEGIQIIDCVEFNDRFRYGDVVSDLAYLHMDLEHLGHPDVSRYFLSAYVQKADDPTLYSLLDFYATYRAVVKMKVLCLQFMEVEEGGKRDLLKNKAEQYLQQAYRYAIQFSRPTLWIFCGLPATGKSQMSEKLARAFSASLLRSDVIRKDLVGLGDQEVVVPYGADIYRRERRNLVYARMLSLAQEELKGGRSVILDASFSLRKWRDEARQLARDLDTSFIVIECRCSQESIEKRLKMRERIPGASDARIQHLPSMIKAFEPLLEVAPEALIQLDTDLPPEKVLMNLLAGSYAKRCEQVERVMRQLD